MHAASPSFILAIGAQGRLLAMFVAQTTGGRLDGWTGTWAAQRPGGGSIRYINVIDYYVGEPLCQSTVEGIN